MKPLENLFYKEQIELGEHKAKLFYVLNLLIQYSLDPVETINKVLSQLTPEDKEYDIFYDISRGFKSVFTKERAVVLGRRNIVFYINNTIKEIIEEMDELTKASVTLLEILDTNIKTILETNNSAQAVVNINKALTEQVRKEYLAFKMTAVLDPKIQAEFSEQQTSESFMCNYLTVLNNTIVDVKGEIDLSAALNRMNNIKTDFNSVKYVIDGIIEKNEALDNIVEYIPKEQPIEPISFDTTEPYLLPTISKQTDTCEADKVETFKTVVEAVDTKIPKLQTEFNKIRTKLNNTTKKNPLTIVLNDIIKRVTEYNEGNYTLEVLTSILQADMIALDNYIYINNQVFNDFMVKLLKINSDVNLLNSASSLNNEILANGTI